MLRGYRTHVKGELHCFQRCFRKQTGRELVNLKHKDRGSVCNDSLSLNLFVAGLKYVNSVSVYF